MKYLKMSLKDSFKYVKERRNLTTFTLFFPQLIDFELKLFGKTSVKMIQIVDRYGKTRVCPDFIAEEYPKLCKLPTVEPKIQDDLSPNETNSATTSDSDYYSVETETL